MIGILGIPRPNGVRILVILSLTKTLLKQSEMQDLLHEIQDSCSPHETLIKTKRNGRYFT